MEQSRQDQLCQNNLTGLAIENGNFQPVNLQLFNIKFSEKLENLKFEKVVRHEGNVCFLSINY